jgi:hypothetical protein
MKRYALIFARGWSAPRNESERKDFTILSTHDTLKEASESRGISGELVISLRTGKIVPSPVWLFQWERLERKDGHIPYAKRMILGKASFSHPLWGEKGR